MLSELKAASALIALSLVALPALAANSSVTFDRIVGNGTAIDYVKLNSNYPLRPQVPAWMCQTTTTKYRGFIEETLAKGYPDVFRVPHSRIFEDGVRCGDKNDSYPLEYLYVENHMRLFPFRLIKSIDLATEAGIIAPYRLLADGYNNHTRHIAEQLEAEVVNNDLWVGFEDNARECGGKTVLKAQTFLLFGRSRGNTHIKVQFAELLNPDTKERVNQTSYVYETNEDIQISFFEPFGDPAEVVDLVCPSQNSLFDPNPPFVASNETSTPSDKGDDPDSGSCFPSDASVHVEGQGEVRMDALKVGDRVLGAKGQFTEIFMFTHKLQNKKSTFVNLSTASGKTLSLTMGHYMYADGFLKPAGDVKVGSIVRLVDGTSDIVTSIGSRTGLGLYNPQTVSGDIAVNGIVTSTYTTAIDPILAHAVLAPFRFLFKAYRVSVTSFEGGAKLFHPLLRALQTKAISGSVLL